jgi:succinate-semialdehyde dehydrogenase/glutarate-semialdehyde dehydrogenase
VCIKNVEKAIGFADKVKDGAYFIHESVKSNPRLPFWGNKKSAYGRELFKDVILEFVNRKTIYVKK